MSTVLSGFLRPLSRLTASAVVAFAMTIAGSAFAQVRAAPPKPDVVRPDTTKSDAGPQVALPAAPVRLETVAVMVDRAKVLRLPEKVQTVVIGNPGIADVTVQKNGVMIVTGKSFGVTNLIALDETGALLAESLVRVGAASDSTVTVQRGLERESYSCTPVCQPSVQLGDSAAYFGEAGNQAQRRNSLAVGK